MRNDMPTKREYETLDEFIKHNCASCIYVHEPNKKGQLICTSYEYAGIINEETLACCTDIHCDDYETEEE
jgi:hypothetical protein